MSFYDIDLSIFKFINHTLSNQVFDYLAPIFRNKLSWIPLYLYWLYLLYNRYGKKIVYIVLFAIVLIILCDNTCARLLKPFIERARPCTILSTLDWYKSFGLCSSTYSFPSCHATNHTAIAVFMNYFLNRHWSKYLIVWVSLVCFSQVYVGVHYPLDILGGVALGGFLGFIVRYLYAEFENRKL